MSSKPRMRLSTSASQQPMKVVYIKTQYVETDAHSFKSVVQNLTGKNSTVPDTDDSRTRVMEKVKREMKSSQQDMGRGANYSFLSKNLSFKEVDRLMKELPPLDELHKLLTFD